MVNNNSDELQNRKPSFFSPFFLVLVGFLLILGTFLTYFLSNQKSKSTFKLNESSFIQTKAEFKKFTSESDFRQYLQKSMNGASSFGVTNAVTSRTQTSEGVALPPTASYGFSDLKSSAAEPDRVSQTNVQVMGIDEPDIVKNNNRNIFYYRQGNYYGRPVPLMQEKLIAPEQNLDDQIDILNAFPPESMSKIGEIDGGGQMFLHNNILVTIRPDAIYGYDISVPASPKESWKMELKSGNNVVESRLYNDKLYVVLQNNIDLSSPCPLNPATLRGQNIVIDCTSIYHPGPSINADATFTAMIINPIDGTSQNNLSFVGSYSGSVIYMSPNGLYVTYANEPDMIAFLIKFFDEKASDIVPLETRDRLKKLQTYDISYAAKMTEVTQILQAYMYGQASDTEVATQTKLQNRMMEYAQEHLRDLTSTQIVKLDINNLMQVASTLVPGTLLNQFSLDEHNENLRVAVTVGGWAQFGNIETANDLYILDKNLRPRGDIKDMGLTERIYSARFIGDKGYLVTFKQVDPFYVMDLSNPDKPQVTGELKIPGFSSYLHPFKDNLMLGIGREDSQVKASLFDVTDPANPQEISKYILNDYSSEILQTHHAFLHDAKNETFFIPGTNNGYVLSYKGNKLNLAKAIANIAPQRALYLNDYMYILGSDEIVVYNQENWNEVKRLKLQ